MKLKENKKTLLLILCIFGLGGAWMGIMIPYQIKGQELYQVQTARLQLKQFNKALKGYYQLKGHYPTTYLDMQKALAQAKSMYLPVRLDEQSGQIVDKFPWDPWGNDFEYLLLKESYDLYSKGKDGKADTKDDIK